MAGHTVNKHEAHEKVKKLLIEHGHVEHAFGVEIVAMENSGDRLVDDVLMIIDDFNVWSKKRKEVKVIILDNNPLSIVSYIEEFGDKNKEIK